MTSDDLAYKISTQDFSRTRPKNVAPKFFEIIWPFLSIEKQKEFLNQVHQMKTLFFALELGLELEKIGKLKSNFQRRLNVIFYKQSLMIFLGKKIPVDLGKLFSTSKKRWELENRDLTEQFFEDILRKLDVRENDLSTKFYEVGLENP